MLGALLYLRVTSLRNQLISRLKRLRNPKYFAGAIFGLAYFYFFFFRHVVGSPSAPRAGKHAAQAAQNLPINFADTLPLVAGLGALLMLVIVILAWVLPNERPGLRFTEAETAFLFPAPISRRALINFKLLSSQFSILFTSLFFTIISNRWSFLGGNPLTHAIGWWVVLSTLNLHFTGAALTISRLVEGGVSPLRRRLYVFAIILAIVAATLAWVWNGIAAPDADDVAGFAPFSHYLLEIIDTGALGVLLLPFKFVLGPFLAPTTQEFFLALAPALLVVVAHYMWVLRIETSFEEASLAHAEKRTAMVTALREGKRPFAAIRTKGRAAPFHLRDTGRPELAFLWKNLLSTASYINLRVFGIAVGCVLVGSKWYGASDFAHSKASFVVTFMALFAAVYIIVFGPHIARQDLRGDILNSDILKTYPLRGSQLLLGQLLTPIAILTGLVWLCLLAAALTFQPSPKLAATFTPLVQVALAAGGALLAPVLCALQLLLLNGATITFPAWFQTTRVQPGGGGIEVMGQRLMFFAGQLLLLIVALLPAALGAVAGFGLTWLIFYLSGHTELASIPGITVGVLAAFIVLAGETWFGLKWLGTRFEQLDVSSELRP